MWYQCVQLFHIPEIEEEKQSKKNRRSMLTPRYLIHLPTLITVLAQSIHIRVEKLSCVITVPMETKLHPISGQVIDILFSCLVYYPGVEKLIIGAGYQTVSISNQYKGYEWASSFSWFVLFLRKRNAIRWNG